MDPAKKTSISEDTAAVQRLIAAFSGLLVRETEAIRGMNFAAVDALQADKRVLARQYNEVVSALSGRRDEVAELPLAAREDLVRARTAFTVLLNENMNALDAARDSARRMAERILDIARAAVVDDRKTHYSSKGRAAAYKTATQSLSLDRSL